MDKRRILSMIQAFAQMTDIDVSVQLVKAAETHFDYLLKLIDSEGKSRAAVVGKGMHYIATRYSLSLPFEPLEFRKSDKEGFPKVIMLLKTHLRGTPEQKRFSLTITRFYEMIYTIPSVDFSKLTDKGSPIDPIFLDGFDKWSARWVERTIPKVPNLFYGDVHSTYANGPNGPAVAYSHYDACAVRADPTLHGNLNKLLSLTRNVWVKDNLMKCSEGLIPHEPVMHSRISLIPEAGGKTRLIAIGDYWSQQALKPIHDFLMSVLKRMKTDGTYNQDEQTKIIVNSSRICAYSFDLTNATDRFPMEIQEILMSHIFGKDISYYWKQVMVNREFIFNGKGYRWNRGQPLGFLSSWAAFALTHHAIIEYIAFTVGINSFREYGVLGDDVVIWNKDVATKYYSLMNSLVGINEKKSILRHEPPISIEYAKRIFENGVEITGLKYTILKTTARSIKNMPELIELCKKRSWGFDKARFQVPSFLSDKGKRLLALIMFYYYADASETHVFSHKGQTVTFTIEGLKYAVKLLRVQNLLEKQEKVMKFLDDNESITKLLDDQGVSYLESSINSFRDGPPSHPWTMFINKVGVRLTDALTILSSYEPDMENPIMPIEYLPIPSNSLVFDPSRPTFTSNMIWKAAFELLQVANTKDTDHPVHSE